ncbi:hypothetical protein HHI36_007265 [Cryptolaemus montrouzieri]|uniref:WW domain binding protein VOPP1 n=1 Tax=Cryptolaemus montrouzieri TaxID=559131 RepID=A0ABD2MP55_9CUCU
MTTLVGRNCDGGHYTCSPPKECCKQGCCFLLTNSVRAPVLQSGNIFNPLFLGHWYFWLAVTATVAGILCACSLWKRHNQGGVCCRNSGRDDRASEPESNGSFYAPPQYSRCNSFYQPPPPYAEVTSKPDLYPLVISFNGEPVIKAGNGSPGYFMVQYFRNFIVRPVGTLSATSTLDSLSSSFICNASNEANIIVPPPYSGISSLEEVRGANNQETFSIPHSLSSSPSSDFNQVYSAPTHTSSLQNTPFHRPPSRPHSRPHSVVSIRDNPCFTHTTTNLLNSASATMEIPQGSEMSISQFRLDATNCDYAQNQRVQRNPSTRAALTLPKETSQESEDELNFSEILNLSVRAPSGTSNSEAAIRCDSLQLSIANSNTGSDASSLANFRTPDSVSKLSHLSGEMMKELSEEILPQQKSPLPPLQHESRSRSYFHRIKAKTMYMPLNDGPTSTFSKCKASPNSAKIFSRSWLSKSAPTTPCGNFVPNFPSHKRNHSSQKNKGRMEDGSPLLNEHDESEEETNRVQHL